MKLKNPNFFNKDGWDESKPLPSVNKIKSYLMFHNRYWTGSCWNGSRSYAHNVKLYNLGIASEGIDDDRVYDFLSADHPEYDLEVEDLIHDFEIATNREYTAAFNGRSGGYLVLYNKEYPYRGIDDDRDELEELDCSDPDVCKELIERFKLVKRFDALADQIRALLFSYATSTKTKVITLLQPTKVKLTLESDETDVPDYEIRMFLHPQDNKYHACVPELEDFGEPVVSESLDDCILLTEKRIIEYLKTHEDAPKPKRD